MILIIKRCVKNGEIANSMQKKKERNIITFMVGLSIVTFVIDVSVGIYFAVMTNVATNYFSHYTKTYID
jgi:hypothetical protein